MLIKKYTLVTRVYFFVKRLAFLNEGERDTFHVRTAGTADAVDIVLVGRWEVEVDDV
jgi:hypothetical protein